MNYIDVFKRIIKEEDNKTNGDKKVIDNLFNQIKEEVIKTYGPESLMRLPDVDEATLKVILKLLKMNIFRLTQLIQNQSRIN